MEATMHDADEGDELSAVVFHKQNVAVANFELGSISYFHCLTTDSTAQHTQSDRRTRIALDAVFYHQRHVTHDVTLRPLTRPFGAHISHAALKDQFGPGNELIEGRWNNRRGERAAADREDPSASE